jgi:hypothetical protein
MATIVMEKEVDCPPDSAINRVYSAFGASHAAEVTRTLSVPFEDIGLPKVGTLARDVLVTLGDPEHKRSLVRIPLSWRVPDSNAFPIFHGFIEVQSQALDRIQLAILGYYQPPFGTLGVIFDAVAGRKIAHATIHHLLDEISRAIEDESETQRTPGAG